MIVFTIAIAIAAVVIVINNPLAGYKLLYTYIKTSSMEDALSKWTDNDPLKEYHAQRWRYEKRAPDGANYSANVGYFYREKNPWWWIYAYNSMSSENWKLSHWQDTSMFRFESLGGFINFLAFIAIAASF